MPDRPTNPYTNFADAEVSPEGQLPDPVLYERARVAWDAERALIDSFPVLLRDGTIERGQ